MTMRLIAEERMGKFEEFRLEQERELQLYCHGIQRAAFEVMKRGKDAFEKGQDAQAEFARSIAKDLERLIGETDSYRLEWVERQVDKFKPKKTKK